MISGEELTEFMELRRENERLKIELEARKEYTQIVVDRVSVLLTALSAIASHGTDGQHPHHSDCLAECQSIALEALKGK